MAKCAAVFLDLGGVVVHIDWHRPFAFVGRHDGRRQRDLIHRLMGWPQLHRYEKGQISSTEFYAGLSAFTELQRPVPDAEFYQQACELAGVQAHQALFVDDSPANVAAASRVGLTALCSENSVPATLRFLQEQGFSRHE
jgi:FMN phosphatase YigB (HAD superfamily)